MESLPPLRRKNARISFEHLARLLYKVLSNQLTRLHEHACHCDTEVELTAVVAVGQYDVLGLPGSCFVIESELLQCNDWKEST